MEVVLEPKEQFYFTRITYLFDISENKVNGCQSASIKIIMLLEMHQTNECQNIMKQVTIYG